MTNVVCPFCQRMKCICRTVHVMTMAEPRNKHADWCEVWKGNGPCTCGAE